eukprot:TRINITY_DN18880_c0_g1_i2.p1 TRINITY_DN18880_c0_g1~~TRINITY_DN18880_c0_g1_i2.p1  ORF type:complete len:679 (+),score=115.01 TRINITY_DN18880_c0_g1_i2:86-2122(+)
MDALSAAQQSALVALLRTLADAELDVEILRVRLCEVIDFDPYESFRDIQQIWQRPKGFVSAVDLHAWLGSQPSHKASYALLEDVAATLAPYVNGAGELQYEGFLRLVLPRDPSSTWLRELALRRGGVLATAVPYSFVGRDGVPRPIRPEVAHHLCHLLQSEMDMNRRLKYHRRNLMGVSVEMVARFLDAASGLCAGLSGLVSTRAIRKVLVERLRALTPTQCDALVRRINPSDACLAAVEDLNKYLSPPLPPIVTGSSCVPASASVSWSNCFDVNVEPELEVRPWNVKKYGLSSPDQVWSPGRASTQASTADIFTPSPRARSLSRAASPRWPSAPPPPPVHDPGLTREGPHFQSAKYRSYSNGHDSRERSLRKSPSLTSRSGPSPGAFQTSIDWCFESPRGAVSRHFSSASAEAQRLTKAVLRVMLVQADCDLKMEDQKRALPAGCTLEAVFDTVDRYGTNSVAATDLCEFSESFGTGTPYSGFLASVREAKLRHPRSMLSAPGRLNFREFGLLVLPLGSGELEAIQNAVSDVEARSLSKLLRCPSASPSSLALRHSSCDFHLGASKLTKSEQYHVFRLLETSAKGALEVERARLELLATPGYDLAALSNVFSHMCAGNVALCASDLRRALTSSGMPLSPEEFDLLWLRYVHKGSYEVTFSDLARQLKPRSGGSDGDL